MANELLQDDLPSFARQSLPRLTAAAIRERNAHVVALFCPTWREAVLRSARVRLQLNNYQRLPMWAMVLDCQLWHLKQTASCPGTQLLSASLSERKNSRSGMYK